MSNPIRVVVVDDSALMRRVLRELLEQDPDIHVVGSACNGQEAIKVVKMLRPDLVTMDVRMPLMDGLAATEHLMAYCPTPILVLTASLAKFEMDITFRMLGAGALDVVEKPSGTDQREFAHAGREIIRRVKLLARVKVVTHLRGRRKPAPLAEPGVVSTPNQSSPPQHTLLNSGDKPAPARPATAYAPSSFPVIILGASTGGPRVVYQILASLPPFFPAAVLVVQHIAAGFSAGLVDWLATGCQLPIRLATHGAPIRSGEVLVAPDQHDLLISPLSRVRLRSDSTNPQRPAVDATMQTAAEIFGARAIGVLLTGMGRDGAKGMDALRRAGAYTIAQDEASCTIFGMPRAAKELGAVYELLPPAAIATRLSELVAERSAMVAAG